MLDDMELAPALYRPTNHWLGSIDELIDDIVKDGVENFRSSVSALRAFVPCYGFPEYYSSENRYTPLHNALREVFPAETKIVKSQQTTNQRKYDIRLRNLLSGEQYALSDYRLFIGSQIDQHPHTNRASESKVGNPLEQFKFDNRFFSRSFLNYLIGINYLKRVCSPQKMRTVLEIGGGYGTLGEILLSDRRNRCCYIDIDIPPVSYFATYYLQELFGEKKIASYSQYRGADQIAIEEIQNNFKGAVLCPWQLPYLVGEIDLFVNYHSFAEMEPDVVENYCQVICNLKPRYVLLRNLREGKQILRSKGEYGVKKQVIGKDYDKFFSSYRNMGTNTIPFGFKTEDGFHSEVRLYEKID